MERDRNILLKWLDKDEICHGGDKEDYIDEYGVYPTITDAMKQARIDTMQHLISLFQINSKKINGESAIKITEQLIEEIKKA